MPTVLVRFYEELNDFLPENRRKTDFEAQLKGKRSIKDMIEFRQKQKNGAMNMVNAHPVIRYTGKALTL